MYFFHSMSFHWLFNEISMTHLWNKLTQEVHKRDKWSLYRKFVLKGDEINPNKEPDEKGEETKDWITTVVHDPADRQADGRWEGTIIQKKAPVSEIRWAGLYDKNSDKLHAAKQLLPQSDYDAGHKEIFKRHITKSRKLLDEQKKELSEILEDSH